ncbi:MAG: hypothetical protein KF852_19050 [Saprospiraceae bacterium]|nr:hypothetical protein [Saprospiraceae bacterium]
MEPSQFDDFIKSNTQDELPVPTELSWENMNFTLPPAKRKRRILPWMLFFLIGAVGMGSGLWYVYQHDNTQSQPVPENDPIGIQSQNSKISPPKEDASVDMTHPQDAGENTITGNNAENQKTFKPERLAKADMAHPQDAGENTIPGNNAISQKTFKTERLAKTDVEEGKPLSLSQAPKSNDIESAKAETLSLTDPSLLDSTQETSPVRRDLPAPCAFLNVLPVGPVRSTSSENRLTVSSHAHADPDTKHAAKSMALLVSIGTNKAQMNHSSASLNDAETPAWGNSYQILLEKELKNNWLFSIGLGYRRLHSTFYFEKDLGTYVNFSQRQVIRQTRRVFHNNYVDMASLNVGVGKQFIISPRWQSQFLMYLSPSYRFRYTGRAIDDSESIIALGPNTVAQNKWLLNADAALRFSYSLNKTDLIVGVYLSQSLAKSDLFSGSNNTTTVQPRVFGLNLGIKRAL